MENLKELGLSPIEKEEQVATYGGTNDGIRTGKFDIVICCYNIPPTEDIIGFPREPLTAMN